MFLSRRAAVSVFEARDIALGEIAECYLEADEPLGSTKDAVLRVPRAEELVSFASGSLFVSDADGARAFDDAPELITMSMRLQADAFSGVYGDDLHRCLFIQREALEVSPRTIFFRVMSEVFHRIRLVYRAGSGYHTRYARISSPTKESAPVAGPRAVSRTLGFEARARLPHVRRWVRRAVRTPSADTADL